MISDNNILKGSCGFHEKGSEIHFWTVNDSVGFHIFVTDMQHQGMTLTEFNRKMNVLLKNGRDEIVVGDIRNGMVVNVFTYTMLGGTPCVLIEGVWLCTTKSERAKIYNYLSDEFGEREPTVWCIEHVANICATLV